MYSNFFYRVEQFARKKWVSVIETTDLDFAVEQARQRSISTKERVRVIRVDVAEIINFHIY